MITRYCVLFCFGAVMASFLVNVPINQAEVHQTSQHAIGRRLNEVWRQHELAHPEYELVRKAQPSSPRG